MIRKYSLFSNSKNKEHTPYSAKVYAMTDYEALLKHPFRNTLINKIKYNVATTDKYYQALYKPVIDTLGNYLQSLPDIRTFQTEHERFWIDTALIRCTYATRIRAHLQLPPNANNLRAREDYALWTYVIFSASLLWHVGKLSTDFVVGICNEKGEVNKHWKPLVQSLYNAGKHYKVQNINTTPSSSFKSVTPILARNIMPNDGFEWIANDEEALEYWLNALVEEGSAQGQLVNILTLIDQIFLGQLSLEEFIHLLNLDIDLEQFRALKEDLSELEKLVKDLDAEQYPPIQFNEPPETKIGEQFFDWLKDGLENNNIKFNTDDASVHIHKNGIILAYPQIFKEFCQTFHLYKDWVVVYKQFNTLGITKKGGSDTWFSKYFVDLEDIDPGKFRKKEFNGLLVNHTRAIYGQKKMQINQKITQQIQNNQKQIQQKMATIAKQGQKLKKD